MTGTPSQSTADRKTWKEKRAPPKELTRDSSLSTSTYIRQEIMLTLPSKYIQSLTPFPHSCPGVASSWGAERGGLEHEAQRGKELGRHSQPKGGGDRTKSCSILQACPGVWNKQGFPKEGEKATREERCSWQREQHVQRLKETERTSVWLQRPERCEEMKAEAGEAGRGWPLKSPAPG